MAGGNILIDCNMKTLKITIDDKDIEIKVKPQDIDILLNIIALFNQED